jgi:hypothetical protein
VLSLPTQGIPSRSSLSPFFGALYLTPLDRAFEQRSCFYARYMDDAIILCETKNQFVSAKKRLKKIVASLKLKLSPHKTKMGVFKTFHFLGVNFSSAQTELHKNPEKKATIAIHPRSCRRALDKATARKESTVSAADIQQYLIRWALWWKRAVMKKLSVEHMLIAYVHKATELNNPLAWLGRGLLHLSFTNQQGLVG